MARRKKRSRSFGERAHKGRNVLKAIRRAVGARGETHHRRATIGIKVHVGRFTDAGTGRGRFYATACVMGSDARGVRASQGRRCGPDGYGNTPTRAVESALVALAKSHNLRK
jgi:hypothetical protein